MAHGRNRGKCVTNEIRIYVEGGGQGKEPRAAVRNGFHGFLKDIISLARSKRIRFYIIPCGHSSSTLEDFQTALRSHPDAFNILLVDSDSAVTTNPREHLRNHKNWDLSHISDEQCQLMVQITEA